MCSFIYIKYVYINIKHLYLYKIHTFDTFYLYKIYLYLFKIIMYFRHFFQNEEPLCICVCVHGTYTRTLTWGVWLKILEIYDLTGKKSA